MRLLAVLLAWSAAASVSAQEVRRFERIPSPDPRARGAALAAAAGFRPVDERKVERVIRNIVRAWNTPGLPGLLGERFYDSERLIESLASVPRDARLRLLSIEAIQTLEQSEKPATGPGGTATVRSTIGVIARTQVEFNDPRLGFQRRDGVNEYIFELVEKVTR